MSVVRTVAELVDIVERRGNLKVTTTEPAGKLATNSAFVVVQNGVVRVFALKMKCTDGEIANIVDRDDSVVKVSKVEAIISH